MLGISSLMKSVLVIKLILYQCQGVAVRQHMSVSS
jgi:hypothetical protein